MLLTQEKVDFLKTISFFDRLHERQLQKLADICVENAYGKGEVIFQQGDVGGILYIVVEGQVLLERELDRQEDTISMSVVNPQTSFGEISLFYDAPRSVTATAMKNSKLLSMDNDDFKEFIRQYPDMLMEINQVLSQRLVEAHDKISEIARPHKPRELRKLYEKLDF